MTGRRRRGHDRAPYALVPLAAVAVAFVALLQRAPWTSLVDLLDDPVVTDALRLSLTGAFAATALSLLFGVPLAWMLARRFGVSMMGARVLSVQGRRPANGTARPSTS